MTQAWDGQDMLRYLPVSSNTNTLWLPLHELADVHLLMTTLAAHVMFATTATYTLPVCKVHAHSFDLLWNQLHAQHTAKHCSD